MINRDMGALVCILAFIFGIGGIIAAIRSKSNNGIAMCSFSVLLNIFIVYCHPAEGVAREPAKRISCASNIKQIWLSLKQYADDYSGNFPPANGAAGLEYLRKYDYLTNYAVYICPSTRTARGKDIQPLTEENVDYVYIGGFNEKTDPKSPILYDKPGNHQDFGNVLFADGTVNNFKGKDWPEKIKK